MQAGTARKVPFVGRATELAALRVVLADACSGQGSVVLLTGEAGIGKTRLAEKLAAEASARGVVVAWGACYQGQGAPALWPWLQILRTLIGTSAAERLDASAGSRAPDIAALVERLVSGVVVPAVAGRTDWVEDRFVFFDRVATFLVAAAQSQPVLVILDDLHWADVPTLLLLELLASDVGRARLLVVAACRDQDEAEGAPLTRTLERIGATRVALSGLNEVEAERLMHGVAGAPIIAELVSTVHRETEGNPLFIGEFVHLLAREQRLADVPATRLGLPPRVRDMISLRLAALSQACLRALTVAAIIGLEFDLGLLAMAVEDSSEALLAVLTEADVAHASEEYPP